MTASSIDNSLDNILVQLGDFGRYQMLVFSLVCFAIVLHSAAHMAFVFTAMDLDYRCEIPGCDTENLKYDQPWLQNAVPFEGDAPEKCQMYRQIYNSTEAKNETCGATDFNQSNKVKCSKFIYKGPEKSILQEYDLQCDENLWKITMVGTINNIGQFFGLFISGILSDKFGRRLILVWGLVLCAVCALIRTLMPTYNWFLVFEFLDGAFGSGTYICGFVLGVELVGPNTRVLTGVLASSCYTIGELFTAGTAWLVKSWKPLIYIVYTPSLLLLTYIWILPESIRWNISKGRIEEAKQTLKTVAKVNGKELSENALEKLTTMEIDSQVETSPFRDAFRSTKLMLRLVNCCFCWITCAFLFYGLSLHSVSLGAGNSYLDFILTSLVEIPAYLTCNWMLRTFGRKKSLCGSYLLTGAACITFIFVPSASHTTSLVIYLTGKFGATAAFTNLYVVTSEIFPTTMRHSFMGICSTFGRLGSMISPQTPLLAKLWTPLPLISFGVMSGIAGLLTLLFPETANIKLPDTIEEAENISKLSKIITIPPEEENQEKY